MCLVWGVVIEKNFTRHVRGCDASVEYDRRIAEVGRWEEQGLRCTMDQISLKAVKIQNLRKYTS